MVVERAGLQGGGAGRGFHRRGAARPARRPCPGRGRVRRRQFRQKGGRGVRKQRLHRDRQLAEAGQEHPDLVQRHPFEGGVQTKVTQVGAATKTLATQIKAVPAPNTSDGQAAKQQLDQLSTDVTTTISSAKTAVAQIPSGASAGQITLALIPLKPQVQTLLTSAQSAISSLQGRSGSLGSAFKSTASCQSLSRRLTPIGLWISMNTDASWEDNKVQNSLTDNKLKKATQSGRVEHLSVAERVAQGKAARSATPRSAHAVWEPPGADRAPRAARRSRRRPGCRSWCRSATGGCSSRRSRSTAVPPI